jgi:hypothetical protein
VVLSKRDGVRDGGTPPWTPRSIVRLDAPGGRVEYITDYLHCPWVLASVRSLVIPETA